MRPRSRGILLLLALSTVACGDSAPLSVGDALSSEEAAALAEVVMTQGLESGYGLEAAQAPSAAPAQVPVSIDTQVEAPCPLGGVVTVDVSVDGDIDDVTGDADLAVSQVLSHQECSVPHEETDLVFTLNGDPSTTFAAQVTVENETDFSYVGSLDGRVRWETDDERSGTCEIGIDFDMSGTAETGFSITAGGHVCGVEVSESVSVGAV